MTADRLTDAQIALLTAEQILDDMDAAPLATAKMLADTIAHLRSATALAPARPASPDHIQFVRASLAQVDAFNAKLGRWVIYFEDPETGARAQTFADLSRFPGIREPRPETCCDIAAAGLVCRHLGAELIAGIEKLRDECEPATVAIGYALDRLDRAPSPEAKPPAPEPTLRLETYEELAERANRAAAEAKPPATTPCPLGEDCPDARRYGHVHASPAPADPAPRPCRHCGKDLRRWADRDRDGEWCIQCGGYQNDRHGDPPAAPPADEET